VASPLWASSINWPAVAVVAVVVIVVVLVVVGAVSNAISSPMDCVCAYGVPKAKPHKVN